MIKLTLHDGQVFVWSTEDWKELQELRIMGALIGSMAALPRQWKFPGLPLILSPEETSLLVEIGVAQVVCYPSLKEAPSGEQLKNLRSGCALKTAKLAFTDSFSEVEYFRNERKRQVQDMIDSIIEGKKFKMLGYSAKKKKGKKIAGNGSNSQSEESQSAVIDKEAVLKEELAKIDEKQLDSKDLATAPWLDDGEEIDWLDWVCPRTRRETLLYMTYKNLWEKGYFITGAQEFGGDFLVYPGHPSFYHAHFIVICREDNILDAKEVVAFGRLGNSVRKTVILASLSDDESSVVYQSLQWNSLLKQVIK